MAAAPRRLRGQLHVPAGRRPGGAGAGGGTGLPRRLARCPRAPPADEAASALRPGARGRRDARVGREDHPRGGLPLGSGAPPRRRRADRRGRGGPGGRAVPQGHPLRDAVGHPRGERHLRATEGRGRGPGGLQPRPGRLLRHERPAPQPQSAPRLQERLLGGRSAGGAHDADRGRVSGWTHRGAGGCGGGTARRGGSAVQAGREAHLLQGRRGVQVGESDPGRHPEPCARRRRGASRGSRVLCPHVSRGGIRGG